MDILLCLVVLGISAWFCVQFVQNRHAPRIHALCKCVPSISCGLLSLYGWLNHASGCTGGILLCCGLVLCAAADWALEFRFVPGVALFMASHLCFVAAFTLMSGKGPNLLCFVIFLAILYLLLSLVKHSGSSALPVLPLAAYIALISLMTASAFNCGVLFAVGALLFVLSDALLGAHLFGRIKGAYVGWAIMVPYYLALYLFALGCVFYL